MRAFQKNIISLILAAVIMIVVGICFVSLILRANLWTSLKFLHAAIQLIPLLIIFGSLGVLGSGYLAKYGERYFWPLESNNNWPISQKHVIRTLVNFGLIIFFLGIFCYGFLGKEGLLQYVSILIVFSIGTLLSLIILFIGATVSFKCTLRKL